MTARRLVTVAKVLAGLLGAHVTGHLKARRRAKRAKTTRSPSERGRPEEPGPTRHDHPEPGNDAAGNDTAYVDAADNDAPNDDAAGDDAAGGRERARALRLALEQLGPFYVKLGQMLSTRPDIVSEETIAELAKLHDQVSVAPFELFEPMLAEELGPDWESRFEHIERAKPLGSASLAQAYKVVLRGGTAAVLKIQRPDVRLLVLEDMAMMRRVARLVAKGFPGFNAVIDIESALGIILDAMEAELDFTVEAANMERARELASAFEHLAIPDVFMATRKVLVQSLAPGCSISEVDRDSLAEKERAGIGRDLLAFMYRGYFVDRFFHADPHPGNIIVAPGEPAHLIDWGMVGRIDRRMSMTMMTVLLALAHNDGPGLARAWVELGKATPMADLTGFAQDMASLVPKVATASLEDLDFGVTLTSVLKYSTRRGIQTTPLISLLGKSFSNVEGSVRCLAPELALTEVFQGEMRGILFSLAKESLSEVQAARTAMDLLIGHSLAPEQVRGLLRDVTNRDLTLRVGTLPGMGGGRREDRLLLAAAVVGGLWWWRRTRRTKE